MISAAIDAELGAIDGIARWTEHVLGGTAHCTMYTRHLKAVLAARPAYLAVYGVPAYALATVRTVRPKRRRKAATVQLDKALAELMATLTNVGLA